MRERLPHPELGERQREPDGSAHPVFDEPGNFASKPPA